MHLLPPPTERLEFAVADPLDLPGMAALLSDPLVMRYSIRGPRTPEQAREMIEAFQAAQSSQGFSKWTVRRRGTGDFVGYCGLDYYPVEGRPEVELGYRLATAYWGQGLATEAARAVLEWAFRDQRLPYVIAFLDPANLASVRVLQKVGMTRRFATMLSGHPMDVYRIESPRLAA
jgi:[ribosomal protein S5]-alanine N-acetyltransferase